MYRSCKCHLPTVFYILLHTSEGKINSLTTFNKCMEVTTDHIQSSLMGRMILSFSWLILAVYAHIHIPGPSPPCQW